MKLAKITKKAMADLQKIVPEIPEEKKEPENVKMKKEKKKHEVRQSQRKLFD
ncbi:MAG: hypothetical protein VB076_06340 [Synergistaceae bacterium]|nr:hypothetical protein [Synergistaceae bacterium]